MSNRVIHIDPTTNYTRKEKLRRFFLVNKLNTPAGIALQIIFGIGIAAAVAKFGMIAGIMVMAGMIGIPVVYGIVTFARFGIIIFISLAYLIMWFYKLGVSFPMGTLMDGMEGLFLLGLFIKQRKDKDWSLFKGPITKMILIWMGYNFLEAVNPSAESRLAWVYTVRTVAVVMIMYFIFVYYITTRSYLKLLLKLWLGLALFGAVYGLKQQYIGFFPFEERYLHSDPNIELLLFIGGVWRKFSIYSDPVSFSYNMVIATMLCIGLLTGPISKLKRYALLIMIAMCLLSMLSSGTRGAFVLVPFAMLLYVVMKFTPKMLPPLISGVVVIVILIFMPTSNQTLYRFQSAFKPSDDASFNVRKMNQKRIQPFILSHPMGGGLGATGEWGQRFAPNSYLASFPPDSGYVRVAVELGWIGLFLFCTLMFTIMRVGIQNYYRIRDPELKSYCLSMVLVVFALNFGNYPQEALVQFPTNVLFYLVIALIVVTARLDQEENGPFVQS